MQRHTDTAARRGRDTARPAHSRGVVGAALRLFAEHGFEATTMDDIAVAAGVSRSTLFRRFGSKDDVLFADQDELVEEIGALLTESGEEPVAAVCAAARMVLRGYTTDPDVALARYQLVRAHTGLRDREIAMSARYQALFTQHLSRGHTDARTLLAAEVLAAAVIAAHNHVLRGWLRTPGETGAAVAQRLEEALSFVTEELAGSLRAAASGRSRPSGPEGAVLVAVYPAGASGGEVLAKVRAALEAGGPQQLQ
ncbi:TetR/AcrR family transcriptional regulator [Nocardiopsis ansamitocini]|uniref:TetR family transcriptional regulator n=1 Tax=Nocardiopsis ansamitocini TaxID=1670832 RepID=A0A9W6UH98_9ACTN|nr:TetR/AcrR family transcriptional regulator [Nocardiopsis ansamitocini]GLU48631.1 TetR family transcriptional regulator [Nocardiopsis ansamitocini]